MFYRAAFDSNVQLDAVAAEVRPVYLPVDRDGGGSDPAGSTAERSRQHFPETWLWHNAQTQYSTIDSLTYLITLVPVL